ncbi:hypothetical protein FA15DRAFT_707183 [Coprinopsis marcescibilis]|uniref:RRM domain-containing protein n=1 Tax=Coprinopsis marcescibilis TaxID=230819 RepID=A0A5C3KN04_COPMA|nr:hypothetical protein FA15DRAFT_707183 [Coprinopsis marcescibilis]
MRFTCNTTEEDLMRPNARQTRQSTRQRQEKEDEEKEMRSAQKKSKIGKKKGKSVQKPNSKRLSLANRHAKLVAVDQAKRTAKGKEVAAQQQAKKYTSRGISYVYVGNLRPGITDYQLHNLFQAFGKIGRIEIRCSGGQVTSKGMVLPQGMTGPRDRLYATVEYDDSLGGLKALNLDGAAAEGVSDCLVVTTSAAGLPEIGDIIRGRMGAGAASALDERVPGFHDVRKVMGATGQGLNNNGLQLEATEVVDNSIPPRNGEGDDQLTGDATIRPRSDRAKFFGYSFAITVV